MAKFFGYDVKFKNLFFDRAKVMNGVEFYKYHALRLFGFSVREVVRKKVGPPSKTKPRGGPNSGKPPRARTSARVVTLRNVQYAYRPGKWAKRLPRQRKTDSVAAGIPIFSRTKRYFGKSIPEVQEFGGKITTGILRTVATTKTGRVRKKDGKPIEKIQFGAHFPKKVSFRLKKRPYLKPSLKPAVMKMKRRLREVSL